MNEKDRQIYFTKLRLDPYSAPGVLTPLSPGEPVEIEDVKRVPLRPNDIIVVRTATPPTETTIERLREVFRGYQTVILAPGMRLSILGVEKDVL